MRKALSISLAILLTPVLLLALVVVHELGHTLLARLLGDPDSIFYLVKIEQDSACFGCNIYDESKLSWGGNLVVSLGGLLATQIVAVAALFALRLHPGSLVWQRAFSFIALGFAFLDVPVQVIQGLLHDLNDHLWPTNVDLLDFMLLVEAKTTAGQILLKGYLLLVAISYLCAFAWAYRSNKKVPHL